MTMGSYDGAEVCELVGLYLLNQIKKKIVSAQIELYRDVDLAIFRMCPSQEWRWPKRRRHF